MTVLCKSSIYCILVALPFGLQNYHFYALVHLYFTSFHIFTLVYFLLSACLSPKATDPLSRCQPYSLPPSYLGLGLIGRPSLILPLCLITVHGQPSCTVHCLPVLSSGISSPKVAMPFPDEQRNFYCSCCFHKMQAAVGLVVSSLAHCIAFGMGFLFWQADYWHPSARPVIEFPCCFIHACPFTEATIFFHDAKI